MGFLSRGLASVNEGSYINKLENVEEIMPKVENFNEATLINIIEAEANYNNIMQAVAVDELDYFQENGHEIVYEAGNLSGFFAKVKQFFVNLYQKIKGLFKKFIALMDSYTKTDKEFVNKYRKQLLTVNTKDFEYKGYEFTKLNADVGAAMEAAATSIGLKKGIGKYLNSADVEDRTEKLEEMRGEAYKSVSGKSGGNMDAGEFSKELFKAFRNDEDSKVTLENINVANYLSVILDYKTAKKNAEKAFRDLEKEINKNIKDLDAAEKSLVNVTPSKDDAENKKNSTEIKAISDTIYYTKEKLNIGQSINGALLTALKDQNRQAKSICVALMNYKPKNESAGYGDYDGYVGESALDSVTIK